MSHARYLPCTALLACVLLIAACEHDDDTQDAAVDAASADASVIVGQLGGLRWELPCTGAGSAPANCATPEEDIDTRVITGNAGARYQVTLQFRGVVEQKTYSGATTTDGLWAEGGTPDSGSFNIYKLHISAPEQTYYLNNGSSGIDNCFLVDIEKTVDIDTGATVTLEASAGGDGLETKNVDEQGSPIVVPGVSPDPEPYDGQFIQMDVVAVTEGQQ